MAIILAQEDKDVPDKAGMSFFCLLLLNSSKQSADMSTEAKGESSLAKAEAPALLTR